MQQVKQAQSAYRLASQLRRIAPGQYFTLSLHGNEAANPRFQLTVVDTSSQHTAGVLLVPQGRETAYAFGERKGQEEVRCLVPESLLPTAPKCANAYKLLPPSSLMFCQLAAGQSFGRMIFVAFGRGHTFGTMAEVQAELSPVMLQVGSNGRLLSAAWLTANPLHHHHHHHHS